MKANLTTGLSAKSEQTVTDAETAAAIGSGGASVFATPCMIALMENAAYNAVQGALKPGQSTVGIRIDARHLAATPVGAKVWAAAVLSDIDGKKLIFSIEAFDETELIGKAVHKRFIIDEEKFMRKANEKAI